MKIWQSVSSALLSLLLLVGCAAKNPIKQEDVGSSTDARQILQDMAKQLAAAPGFSVEIHSEYDAVQPNGQSIAFRGQRNISLQRPDQLRVDSIRSDGDQGMILLDGKTITGFQPQTNAYIQVEKIGTVDESVVYLVKDLHMSLPLARLLLTQLPQELDQLFTDITYVEQDTLAGVATDHIAARSADVDVQVWVTRGTQRLPQRIIITYKHEPGSPQFRADLSDWDLDPCFSKSLFTWTPPAGAERLAVYSIKPAKQGGKP